MHGKSDKMLHFVSVSEIFLQIEHRGAGARAVGTVADSAEAI
jgi:hypothetical protein